MKKPVPWKGSAAIGSKRKGDLVFRPQIAGLTLNDAVDRVINSNQTGRSELCIWVSWNGQEVLLRRQDIVKLAKDPDRPSLKRP